MAVTPELSEAQRERYSRHLILKHVGEAGQEKLLRSAVLVVGAGGLGSPVLLYLAAAGVGRLGVIDPDRVALSNLQRQVLHRTPGLGKLKVLSAREQLEALNPDVAVEVFPEPLATANASALVSRYDIVVDCTDSFPVRYLLNDTCLREKKPFIFGAVSAFYGQVTTILPGAGPCLRCLFPEEPAHISNPSRVGLLGVIPGVIGTLQALEVLKYLLGCGELLAGRLLVFNGLAGSFAEVPFTRSAGCPACGSAASTGP